MSGKSSGTDRARRVSFACGIVFAVVGRAWAQPADTPKPFHAESYFQLRLTDPEEGGAYGSLRRFRLNLSGSLDTKTTWLAQLFYKDNNRSATDNHLWIQDLWVRRRIGEGSLTVGQVKPPMGLERLTPDNVLATIDRAMVVDSLIPDGNLRRSFARDRGLLWEQRDMARGNVYLAGVFDGNGTFQQDVSGNGPLLTVRATHRAPWSVVGHRDWFQVGGSFAVRRDDRMDFTKALPGTSSLGMAAFRGNDLRWGGELILNRGRLQGQGEYLAARFNGRDGSPNLRASGWYANLVYAVTPRWEGVLRYQTFDPNQTIRDKNDIRWTTLGVNYRLRRRDRVQVNYLVRHEAVNIPRNNLWQAQYQHYLF